MSEKVERKPFAESLSQLFYDVIRSTSDHSLTMKQVELLRKASTDIASLIQLESKLANIQMIKGLQAAVLTAFEGFEEEIDGIQAGLKKKLDKRTLEEALEKFNSPKV